MLIKNAQIITPTEQVRNGWLLVKGGKIAQIGMGTAPDDEETVDAQGNTLIPGFIDVHVHGGVGYEAMDATPEAIQRMAQFYAQHGVTSFLATTWTDAGERIQAALENIAALQGPQPDGATLLGAHVEGPYLNPEKCGAQNMSYIRRANRDEALAWLDLNVVRLLALAPEYEENDWLIEECVRRGITVSAAHTSAKYKDIQKAVSLGLSQATHTYNAMTPLSHREPGVVGAVMTMPEIRCELIADNIHVHPAPMKILYMTKGAEKIILITDAVRGAGMPEGEYQIDERVITVKNGAVRLPDGTLAGSILTMENALCNFLQATGEPLNTLWRTSSLNAAEAIGVADRKGSLEVGKDADLVLVDQNMTALLTVAEGRVVFQRGN